MLQRICEQCGGTQLERCFLAFDFDGTAKPFEIKQCQQCGLAITLPKPKDMDRFYPETYYGSGKKKFSGLIEYLTQLGCKWRADDIQKHVFAGQSPAEKPNVDGHTKLDADSSNLKILDIGCGRAGLLRSLLKQGWECHGTERATFPDSDDFEGLHIFTGDLSEAAYQTAEFDAISIWHVLEHLDDPFEVLDEMARITRPGGLLAVAVPNFSSWQCKIFKSDWFHLDLPRHLYHFDLHSLTQALQARGYRVTSTSTCSFEQNVYGFIQSLMNKLHFLGKPNEFYQLLKKRNGPKQYLKLLMWGLLAGLILPFALLEFVFSCLLKKGASAIIFAHKTVDT